MGLVLFIFVFFPKVFRKQTKPSGKPTNQTRSNPYPRVRLKHVKTSLFWFSRRFFWLSLVFFGIFCFPEGFLENQTKHRENQQKQTRPNPYPRVGLKPLKTLFFGVFPKVLFVLFCMFGFPEGFVRFLNTSGKTKQTNKTKPISKGASETFKNFILLVFPKVLFVLFCCLLFVWFSRRFFGILKTFGKTNKPNKTEPTRLSIGYCITLHYSILDHIIV